MNTENHRTPDPEFVLGEMGTGMMMLGYDPPAEKVPPPDSIPPLHAIDTLDDYLRGYGKILGKKAVTALAPLHVPGHDPLPDFSDMLRDPFPPQKHVIAAGIKMLDEQINGFIVGTMGTGKTLIGMITIHKHAQRSRRQGGHGGKYRAIVLCPDHLIAKWKREMEETVPGAVVHTFDSWKDFLLLANHRVEPQGGPAAEVARGARWASPKAPSGTSSAATRPSGIPTGWRSPIPTWGSVARRSRRPRVGRIIPVDREVVTDETGARSSTRGRGNPRFGSSPPGPSPAPDAARCPATSRASRSPPRNSRRSSTAAPACSSRR